MVTETTIKQEYKQTEVGVIPEDWEVKNLGDLISSLEAGVSVNSVDKEKNIFNHDASILKTSCVIGGKFISEERKIIVPWDLHRAKLNPRKDSIVISRMNTPALVGECGYIDQDYPNLFLPDRLWMTLHKTQVPHSVLWLAYLLSSTIFNRVIKASATGTSGSMKNISKPSLLAVQILFPPTKAEQEAIAGALSDADALLESLEQLITKKRQIKQGAMQELLSGKKRLPGFSGEWEVKILGDLLYYEQPTKYLIKDIEYNDNNDTPVLTAGKTFILGYTNEVFGIFNNIPVIIFDDFTTVNKFVTFPFKAKSSAMKMLMSTGEDVNLRFVYEKMQLIDFPLGDHKRYWISEYQNLEIEMPKPEEQTAIATILSDMDTDIERLEQKRDKYTMLKQGMMQQLLTGKIRIHATN